MPNTLEGIELPIEIQWVNEFAGQGVGQVQTPTLTGALIIEEIPIIAARRITLSSGDDAAWVHRSVVEQLEALAATPLTTGQTLTLNWGDGRSFNVHFDHSQGAPFEAEEVKRLAADAQPETHPYFITLNLITA